MSLISDPSHAGEVLQELFLGPFGLSSCILSKRIHMPRTRIERLMRGDTALTFDTAVRLDKVFGTTTEYWISCRWQLLKNALRCFGIVKPVGHLWHR